MGSAARMGRLTSSAAHKRCCRSLQCRRRTGAGPRPWFAAGRGVAPELGLRLVDHRRVTVQVADIEQSWRPAPSDCAISWRLRKARTMRACGSCTKALVAGSMPCMPATKTKSPALAPRLQVPSALMAPGGSSVLTPFGDCAWARAKLVARAIAGKQGRARRCNIWRSISDRCALRTVMSYRVRHGARPLASVNSTNSAFDLARRLV
jgi:hypothetical protein